MLLGAGDTHKANHAGNVSTLQGWLSHNGLCTYCEIIHTTNTPLKEEKLSWFLLFTHFSYMIVVNICFVAINAFLMWFQLDRVLCYPKFQEYIISFKAANITYVLSFDIYPVVDFQAKIELSKVQEAIYPFTF